MRIIIACEESQEVCKAFRNKGHESYSCDLQSCSGNHSEWHIKGDAREICMDNWNIAICFPPCTHLAVSGAKHFEQKRFDGRQQLGIDFFMFFTRLDHIQKVAIENPIGIMSRLYRKPDQIIHPWHFGDTYQKSTCLWLKKLPKLYHSDHIDLFNDKITHVDKGDFKITEGGNKMASWYYDSKTSDKNNTSKSRSKTFPGIAHAMAEQWG